MSSQTLKHSSTIIPSKSAPILSHKASRILGRIGHGTDSASVKSHNKQFHPSNLLDIIRNNTAALLHNLGNKLKTVAQKIEPNEFRQHGKKKSVDSEIARMEIARMEIEEYKRVKGFDAYRLNAPFGPLNSNPMLEKDLKVVEKARADQGNFVEVRTRDSLDSEHEFEEN